MFEDLEVTQSDSHSPRILCVSIYPQLAHSIKDLAKELKLEIDIYEGGIYSNGHLFANEVQENYDVVISQAGTAVALEATLKTPVISINISTADIIHGLEKAQQHQKKMVLVCYQKGDIEEDVKMMAKKLYGQNLSILTYNSKDDFKDCVGEVLTMRNHVILGFGSCIETMAKELDIPYILISSSKKNIRRALLSARNIVEQNIQQKLAARRLLHLINHNREGIISINKNNTIHVCNTTAKRMLSLSTAQAAGANIFDDDMPKCLQQLYADGSVLINSPLELNGVFYIVSRIPIVVRSQLHETVITFQKLAQIQKVEAKARAQIYKKGLVANYTFDDIHYKNSKMAELVITAKQYAGTMANILIEGETGTGKELFAQSIHIASPRRDGPFVAVNCAALPDNLLESELFGYEAGAFTGAKTGGKIGLFELAHNGTIFLDEISELPLNIQGKLLRVLQEKEVFRLGGDKVKKVDVRTVAATNKNLWTMVEAGTFRRDLFFRLNLLPLHIPTLRDRLDDIPTLVHHLSKYYGEKYEVDLPKPHKNTIAQLQDYFWPGNIRELANLIERACIMLPYNHNVDDLIISLFESHLTMQERSSKHETSFAHSSDAITIPCGTMKEMENTILRLMLEKADGKTNILAKMLGVSRVTVWKKLKEMDDSPIIQ